MIYDRPVPYCDSEMICDLCGKKNATTLQGFLFICADCLDEGKKALELLRVAKEQLTWHEGRETRLYKCSAKKWSIGIGRNVEDVGVREEEIDFMFARDFQESLRLLKEIFPGWNEYAIGRKVALIDLMHNFGFRRFMKFKDMRRAILEGDWETAAEELTDSVWWKENQVSFGRRMTVYEELLTGIFKRWKVDED